MLHLSVIFAIGAVLFVAERIWAGRGLPRAAGWYLRAVFLNGCQLAIVLFAGLTWDQWFQGWSLLSLAGRVPPIVEGFLAWFIGTFVFYWWHRLRHVSSLCWLVFHQIHHSPARIEVVTAFYKHPVEMAANSIIASAIVYVLLGGSLEAAAWFNVFAAGGEFFYHSNLRTPHWIGWFLQRPEHHSIHHQYRVHHYNYGDITWWDRLFGTFRDAAPREFAARCGYDEGLEQRLGPMLAFADVNRG
jgi:sterol desaturase/sphingolipid hydroxylase (fatty acid hydroxylase superfamily)